MTVAVRGMSHRMAISPTKSPSFSVATGMLPASVVDADLGLAVQDHIGGIAAVAHAEQHLPVMVGHRVGGVGEQLQLAGVDAGEQRHAAQDLDFVAREGSRLTSSPACILVIAAFPICLYATRAGSGSSTPPAHGSADCRLRT